jgi:hypothetical protein
MGFLFTLPDLPTEGISGSIPVFCGFFYGSIVRFPNFENALLCFACFLFPEGDGLNSSKIRPMGHTGVIRIFSFEFPT